MPSAFEFERINLRLLIVMSSVKRLVSLGNAAEDAVLSRRGFLSNAFSGLAGVALSTLLHEDLAVGKPANGWKPGSGAAQFEPKAARVLQIFCPGGASHLDLWDYKPELAKHHGEPLPGEENFLSFQGKSGTLMKSPWLFAPAGESGRMISTLLPNMARHVNDIAFIHSMTSKTNTHGPGCVFMNTGTIFEGFPSAGAWVGYALGSENENLPAYVAIPDIRGEPPNGKANWSNGFLPAQFQGVVTTAQQPIRNLSRPPGISPYEDAATRDFVRTLDEQHAAQHPGMPELKARMDAYQLAARMQLSAPQVSDLSLESQSTRTLYGADDANPLKAAYAKNCLLARRLLEQGVRYVNLYCASRASGVDGLLNWDAHKTLQADYNRHAPIFDQPTAALLTDLKQRGLLEDTLVLWTTEFGRMPTRQAGVTGRDHNPDGFTCWMMGAGVKGGATVGATDEFGRRAAVDPVTVWDFYATVLHILGLDHTHVTYYHNGLNRRLTDVHGSILESLLV
jgi:hypothetical protein